MMNRTKQTRRDPHAAINNLTHAEVAAIVQKQHPRVKGPYIDELAKKAIAQAHRLVSPRK